MTNHLRTLSARLVTCWLPGPRLLLVPAWDWLAAETDNLDEKQRCLEAILELEPDLEWAREALADWLLLRGDAPGPLFLKVWKGGHVKPGRLTTQAVYHILANLYNCSGFAAQAQAQTCYEYCLGQRAGDIHDLDRDNDGVACEVLP